MMLSVTWRDWGLGFRVGGSYEGNDVVGAPEAAAAGGRCGGVGVEGNG